MRAIIVTPSFYPMVGGVELYVLNLARELVAKGHQIQILTPDSVMNQKLSPKHEVIDGIGVYRLNTLFDLSYRVKWWPSLGETIKRLSPEIVHVYSQDLYSWSALRACKEIDIPLLLTTYGPFSEHNERGRIASISLSLYDSWVAPRIIRNAAGVNIRYPELSGWLQQQRVPQGLVHLEPSCIPSNYLQAGDGESFRRESQITARFVLYLGRISKQKGVHHLVRAVELLRQQEKDVELVVMGPESTMISGDFPGWVHVLPSTSSPEMERNVIAASDIFVMPSFFEGFSQAVMKAIAQGKRVIVSNVGGLPFEVGYGKYGTLVPYGRPDLIRDAILESLESAANSEEAKEYASQFTFERNAAAIESQYLDLINHN